MDERRDHPAIRQPEIGYKIPDLDPGTVIREPEPLSQLGSPATSRPVRALNDEEARRNNLKPLRVVVRQILTRFSFR